MSLRRACLGGPRLASRLQPRVTVSRLGLGRSYASIPPSPSESSTLRRNALLAAGLLTTSAILYYYEITTAGPSSALSSLSGETFTIAAGGKNYTFNRLSEAEAEKKLVANEETREISRRGNPVFKVDRSWLGSNEPCEDRMASDLIPRDTLPGSPASAPAPKGRSGGDEVEEGSRDLVFASVLDGHAGDATSILLSNVLHPTLSVALAGLQAGHAPQVTGWKAILEWTNPASWFGATVWTPSNIAQTVQDAFTSLDHNICFGPLQHLPKQGQQAPADVPGGPAAAEGPTPAQTFVALAGPAVAGACAITALVDASSDGLFVASAGDCRAVAGWQREDGSWRCDVLSEDQMGENPKEVERMRSEHPASEREDVIRRGRVFGGLQPTRAFGDAVYKWNLEQGTAVNEVFAAEGQKGRRQSNNCKTPPYVTARPDVAYRRIERPGEKLRFVVMATDGLWDRISSEEAVLLMASYLNPPPTAALPKTSLPEQYPLTAPVEPRAFPAEPLPATTDKKKNGSWVYGDKNAATHLIRNSLAGGDVEKRNELLSLHGDVSRWLRDDISVQYVPVPTLVHRPLIVQGVILW